MKDVRQIAIERLPEIFDLIHKLKRALKKNPQIPPEAIDHLVEAGIHLQLAQYTLEHGEVPELKDRPEKEN